jgi:hypothetical protein
MKFDQLSFLKIEQRLTDSFLKNHFNKRAVARISRKREFVLENEENARKKKNIRPLLILNHSYSWSVTY